MRVLKLGTKILISFFIVIAFFALSISVLGFYVIKHDIIEKAQTQIKNDLNSAREIYREETENIKDIVRFTALRFFLKDALEGNDVGALKTELNLISKRESLDILTLTDQNGKVLFRARNPSVCGDNQEHDELVGSVLSHGKVIAGTAIVPRHELIKEGVDLADRAYIDFVQTPKAKPDAEGKQTSGMMIKAAAPVFSHGGKLLGVLYGGNLLNRNYRIVDRIKDVVYEGVTHKGKEIGTATIFQGDLRISTNVRGEQGNRAIGTRVSEEVYEQVLVKGLPWTNKAFVVSDWYKTAYEPIKNINGQVVGMLYVGTLEKPFVEMTRNVFLLFLLIVAVASLVAGGLALILARAISRPLANMLKATEKLSQGDLGYKVSVEKGTAELDTLVASFNAMSSRLHEREYRLKVSNERLAVLNKTYLDLVGFVSHELKGIVAPAIANAYAVRDGLLGVISSQQKDALDSVTHNLDYLAGTVKKFLDLSRIEKNELQANRVETFLREEIFEASLETFAAKICERRIDIVNNIQPQLRAKCDRDLLCIAVNNLIDNAVKYAFEGGKIVLSSEDLGNRIRVEIYNDSVPVKDEEKSKLFKKFSRLAVSGEKRIKGTGLGLFIAKEIIVRHSGDIWIEPREYGNSFVFEIEKDSQW